MRIHTNVIGYTQTLRNIVSDMPGVRVHVSPYGSRARTHAYEIRLTGTSPRRTMDNRDQAATWDEWGVFFARLFDLDPDALAGSAKHPNYADADDFHHKTGQRFANLTMPADTHPLHRWEHNGSVLACTKCSATLNNN